jgi:hypothetical protein
MAKKLDDTERALLISKFVHAFFDAKDVAEKTEKRTPIRGFGGWYVHFSGDSEED